MTMDFLKAEQLGSAKWRVLAIPFGGERSGKDTDGEYFSRRTDIKHNWFPERPVLFHHGQDPVVKDDVIGVLDDLTLDEELGWWGQMWLDRSHRFHADMDALLRAGKMYGSSGALGHLVRKARDGEILVWPLVEETLTPTPANRLSRLEPAKALADFTSAGMSTKAVEALVAAEPDGLTGDLPADLPDEGGDEAAIARLEELAVEVARLATRIRKLR